MMNEMKEDYAQTSEEEVEREGKLLLRRRRCQAVVLAHRHLQLYTLHTGTHGDVLTVLLLLS